MVRETTMPVRLILVRHGESEGNWAKYAERRGEKVFTEEFRSRHSGDYRLTDLGITQAQAAGKWLRRHGPGAFDEYFVSSYTRAMETAVHLSLPNARWRVESMIRERDYGDIDLMSEFERDRRFHEAMRHHKVYPLRWIPPNGESLLHVCETRIRMMLDRFHRQHGEHEVIIVAHGEIMWCFRYLLENMSEERYNELEHSDDPKDRIHNCQIIEYTRRDPVSGYLYDKLKYMRSVNPLDPEADGENWVSISERQRYTNEALAALVAQKPRYIAGG